MTALSFLEILLVLIRVLVYTTSFLFGFCCVRGVVETRYGMVVYLRQLHSIRISPKKGFLVTDYGMIMRRAGCNGSHLYPYPAILCVSDSIPSLYPLLRHIPYSNPPLPSNTFLRFSLHLTQLTPPS